MFDPGKVLVVGTTTDYIHWIRTSRPGQALFLTDPAFRKRAAEPRPEAAEELLCDLDNPILVQQQLQHHLVSHHLKLVGITCYDCESLELAATLAAHFRLPYPSLASIRNCRDKQRSKMLWRTQGVPCPAIREVDTPEAAARFCEEMERPLVLKPASGSGSELVFRCWSRKECLRAMATIGHELQQRSRQGTSLYRENRRVLAEEWISGPEFSCDFSIRNGQVRLLRLTRKIPHPHAPFGTTLAYVLLMPDSPCSGPDQNQLTRTMQAAAAALGIDHAICMADFLLTPAGPCLLEMTPRPGGDCIPHLLRRACNFDMLAWSFDFSRQEMPVTSPSCREMYIGLRLHADGVGQLGASPAMKKKRDPWLREIEIIRQPGHRITMPPADYDSWYLGYAILQADPAADLPQMTARCLEIRRQLLLEAGCPC